MAPGSRHSGMAKWKTDTYMLSAARMRVRFSEGESVTRFVIQPVQVACVALVELVLQNVVEFVPVVNPPKIEYVCSYETLYETLNGRVSDFDTRARARTSSELYTDIVGRCGHTEPHRPPRRAPHEPRCTVLQTNDSTRLPRDVRVK